MAAMRLSRIPREENHIKQLNEKVAIVTGAGQGIGRGIAMCLAKRGVKVVCTGRREAPSSRPSPKSRSLEARDLP